MKAAKWAESGPGPRSQEPRAGRMPMHDKNARRNAAISNIVAKFIHAMYFYVYAFKNVYIGHKKPTQMTFNYSFYFFLQKRIDFFYKND